MFRLLMKYKGMLLIFSDMACIVFSAILSKFFLGNSAAWLPLKSAFWIILPGLLTFYIFKLYNASLRFFSLYDVISAAVANLSFSLIKLFMISYYAKNAAFSIIPDKTSIAALLIFDYFTSSFLILATRLLPRVILTAAETDLAKNYFHKLPKDCPGKNIKRVLLIGAGQAGEMVLRETKRNIILPVHIAGILDDDKSKKGTQIHGVKVLGTTEDLNHYAEKLEIDEVIIAIPSILGSELRRITRQCKDSKIRFKVLPGLSDLIEGAMLNLQFKDLNIEDLLRRKPADIDINEIAGYVTGNKILVTGAGGSIGSEICKQLLPFRPSQLLVLGRGENSIYTLLGAIKEAAETYQVEIIPLIVDIRDKKKIDSLFAQHKPDLVFHAAAHKHVPLMELNPEEAVKNNVFGTQNLIEAAHKNNTEAFVIISTDKAVNPTSVMGTTKRISEKIMSSYAAKSQTRFCAVRFGNVLGSRGSVIPLFKKQIEERKEVTVTHPEMVRYFMTIPEASKLVIQAGAYGKKGEVFVLDMGEPVKIVDLATDLIKLAGLEPDKDIKITFTGMRPGEKLYEELLTTAENTTATKNQKIFVAKTEKINEELLNKQLAKLLTLAEKCEINSMLECMREIEPTFTPNRDMLPHEATNLFKQGLKEKKLPHGKPELKIIQ